MFRNKQKQSLVKDFDSAPQTEYQKILGRGGVGQVTAHLDPALRRLVAVKTLLNETKEHPHHIKSMVREARLLGYLQHPGIVPLHYAQVDKQGHFTYTMQMIEGEALSDMIDDSVDTGWLLPIPQVLSIITKICETLDYVHDKGVVHLDLKPSNIMLGRHGEVFLVDWGNSRLFDPTHYAAFLDKHGLAHDDLLAEGEMQLISGTPPYMAPEQFTPESIKAAPSTDIFALGCMMYVMLTHKHAFPFDGDVKAYYRSFRERQPKMIHELRGDVPRQLSHICAKMMQPRPEARFQSIRAVIKELEGLSDTASTFSMRHLQRGEILFQEGDVGEEAYLILSGYVEIFTEVDGERKFLATRGEGEIIGELAVFNKESRSASVRAVVPTVLKVMTEKAIETELEKLSPWVGQMISGLSHKFRTLNEQFVKQTSG